MKFGGGNIKNLMKQASKMKEQMEKLQAEAGEKTVEATSGGGMVGLLSSCLERSFRQSAGRLPLPHPLWQHEFAAARTRLDVAQRRPGRGCC